MTGEVDDLEVWVNDARSAPTGFAASPDAAAGSEAGLRADDVDDVTDAVLAASRLLVAVSARSIAAVEDDVTLPQFRMLVVLASRGPLKAGTLAEILDVHPSTSTRMADRLDASGMLTRGGMPGNRREVLVSLTDSGRTLVDEVTRRRRSQIAHIVARMPPNLRGPLVSALRAFTIAGDEPTMTRDASPLGWT